MPLRLHVTGVIQYGQMADFLSAVRQFVAYRRKQNWSAPRVSTAVSGPMNTVLMVFDYATAAAWQQEEAAAMLDPEYGRLASAMPFIENSLRYDLFQPLTDI